ncbi:hypothetical protein GUF49_14015, partial [Xanthomonas citri pv. citri]|nr:hypothetical protein [Xanthomonas citri pv. citri]
IYLNMVDAVSGVEEAKRRCASYDAWLVEPEGWLHHEIYKEIYRLGYYQAAWWIGGSDQASEGLWIWERTGKPMPMGTPHWEHCAPTQ